MPVAQGLLRCVSTDSACSVRGVAVSTCSSNYLGLHACRDQLQGGPKLNSSPLPLNDKTASCQASRTFYMLQMHVCGEEDRGP